MSERPIEAVFFDFGGTLIYNEPDPDVMYSAVLSRFGISVKPEAVREATSSLEAEMAAFGPRSPDAEAEFWRRYDRMIADRLGYGIKAGLLEALSHAFRHEIKVLLYPDVIPTLEALRARGLRLGIISNANFEVLERIEEVSLTSRFDSITYSAAVGANKPNRRIFDAALTTLRVPAEHAAHIGDSYEADYLGAKAAGMFAVWLDREGKDSQPGLRISALSELPSLVE